MKGLLIFAAGLAVGAVAGAVIVKNKVLADAKAEIEEVREYYRESRGAKEVEEVKEKVEETIDRIQDLIEEHVEEVKKVEKKEYELKDIQIKDEPKTEKEHTNYNQIAKMYTSKNECQTPTTYEPYNSTTMYDDPFVIDPSEFGENPEYDTETLTYFADGVLVDDVDDVIEEPDIVVGLENLKIFEEFGATSVYVRNDIYKTDYEIIRDDWNYSDLKEPVEPPVKEKKPHQL